MRYVFDEVEFGKARGWWKSIAILTCLCFVSVEVWAAAALAYEDSTRILGYGIGADKASAKAASLQDCENNGATDPIFWFWNAGPGWGAAARGDNLAIGGALGYTKKKKAKKRAKQECIDGGGTNCQIVELFYDSVGKDGQKGGKKSGHIPAID